MSIKIKKDGQVREFILPATNIQVLDMADKFKKKDLENVIKEISDTEHIYIGEVDETKDGIWIDDGEILDNAEDNGVVERIKEYVDGQIKDYSNPNLLVNGDFQVWSNGTDITTTVSKQEVADKWNVWHTGMNVTKLTNTSPSVGLNSLKLINTMDTAQKVYMYQQIKDYEKLEGKRVTASFYIRGVGGFSGSFGFTVGTSAGINITVTNEWQRIIFSKEVTFNNAKQDYNKGFFFYGVNSNLFNKNTGVEIAGCKLELGSVATPFVPKSYSEELLACNDGVIGSNPNLLINGDFQVWQRGTSFTLPNNNKYTADRWRTYSYTTENCVISQDKNGMIIENTNTVNCSLNIYNQLEEKDIQNLWGKQVTVSFEYEIINGQVEVGCEIRQTKSTNLNDGTRVTDGKFIKYKTGDKGKFVTTTTNSLLLNYLGFQVCLFINNNHAKETSFKVKLSNVKLEVGTVATPFTPRPYGEELSLCQRYYYKNDGTYKLFRADYCNSVGFEFSYFLPSAMRVVPTMGGIDRFRMLNPNNSWKEETGYSFSCSCGITDGILKITANKDNKTSTDAALIIYDGFYLDAEIY